MVSVLVPAEGLHQMRAGAATRGARYAIPVPDDWVHALETFLVCAVFAPVVAGLVLKAFGIDPRTENRHRDG